MEQEGTSAYLSSAWRPHSRTVQGDLLDSFSWSWCWRDQANTHTGWREESWPQRVRGSLWKGRTFTGLSLPSKDLLAVASEGGVPAGAQTTSEGAALSY